MLHLANKPEGDLRAEIRLPGSAPAADTLCHEGDDRETKGSDISPLDAATAAPKLETDR